MQTIRKRLRTPLFFDYFVPLQELLHKIGSVYLEDHQIEDEESFVSEAEKSYASFASNS